ncbi:MAG: alanine--glyoxylate aminotransferase family protein [Ignavibacteriae bacterium]|nr:alanine--glyoxylate aminotransferase family protein [Ignavibacteriota bacterium]MCB9216284.1 alanine--glyoxylate aminotransferase family protein [Ignavibacteria bacterium]
MKTRLYTPGPTPVPEGVMLRMARPIIHHRTEEFKNAFAEVNENLQYLFCTEEPVLTLTSSGTGGMEAALANTLCRGEEVITVNGGKFGERWGEIATAYGLVNRQIDVEWGTAVTVEMIRERLVSYPNARAICLTHSETSTGVFTDIKEIASAVRDEFDGLIIVDGITAVGAHEMRFDEWGIDVAVTGSQKGLMIPPGLAFITLSKRAWDAAEKSDLPSFYFDLKRARVAYEKGDTAWTPAVTLVLGLREALAMIRSEGREQVWRRHARLAAGLRSGLTALGFELFGAPPSNAVTSVLLPEGGSSFEKVMKQKYGITMAGGQEALKGKIFRVSHLGYYDDGDMLTFLHYVERTMSDLELTFEAGAGVSAAQQTFTSLLAEELPTS